MWCLLQVTSNWFTTMYVQFLSLQLISDKWKKVSTLCIVCTRHQISIPRFLNKIDACLGNCLISHTGHNNKSTDLYEVLIMCQALEPVLHASHLNFTASLISSQHLQTLNTFERKGGIKVGKKAGWEGLKETIKEGIILIL